MEAVLTSSTSISNYELERGKPMPDILHSLTQQRLLFLLMFHYRDQYEIMPELNVIFKKKKQVPDLSIYRKNQLDFSENRTNVEEIPVGAIEILSGQQPILQLTSKMKKYLQTGVRSYWLVLPELKSIYVFHTPEDSLIFSKKDILKDEILGVELDLSEVFKK